MPKEPLKLWGVKISTLYKKVLWFTVFMFLTAVSLELLWLLLKQTLGLLRYGQGIYIW